MRGDRLGLDELPAALFRKNTLRELVLSHNQLHSLPAGINGLRQLQVRSGGGMRAAWVAQIAA